MSPLKEKAAHKWRGVKPQNIGWNHMKRKDPKVKSCRNLGWKKLSTFLCQLLLSWPFIVFLWQLSLLHDIGMQHCHNTDWNVGRRCILLNSVLSSPCHSSTISHLQKYAGLPGDHNVVRCCQFPFDPKRCIYKKESPAMEYDGFVPVSTHKLPTNLNLTIQFNGSARAPSPVQMILTLPNH